MYRKDKGMSIPLLVGGVDIGASKNQPEHFKQPMTVQEKAFISETAARLSPPALQYYASIMMRNFKENKNTAALLCLGGDAEKQYLFTPSELYANRGKGNMHLHYGLFGLAPENYPKLRSKLLRAKVYITDTNIQDAGQLKYVLGEIRQSLPNNTPPDLITHISNADDVKYAYIRSLRHIETSLKQLVFERTIGKAMLLSTNFARMIDKAGTTKTCVPSSWRGEKCPEYMEKQDR